MINPTVGWMDSVAKAAVVTQPWSRQRGWKSRKPIAMGIPQTLTDTLYSLVRSYMVSYSYVLQCSCRFSLWQIIHLRPNGVQKRTGLGKGVRGAKTERTRERKRTIISPCFDYQLTHATVAVLRPKSRPIGVWPVSGVHYGEGNITETVVLLKYLNLASKVSAILEYYVAPSCHAHFPF